MKTRGIRGAITVKKNEKSEILTATQELMGKIINRERTSRGRGSRYPIHSHRGSYGSVSSRSGAGNGLDPHSADVLPGNEG